MEGAFDMFGFIAGILTGAAATFGVAAFFLSKQTTLINHLEQIVEDETRLENNQLSNRFYTLLEQAYVRGPKGIFVRATDILPLSTDDLYEVSVIRNNKPITTPRKGKSPKQGSLDIS